MTLPTVGPNPNSDTDADNVRDDEYGETDARNVRSARNGTSAAVEGSGGGAPGGNVRDPDPPVDPPPNQAPIAKLSILSAIDVTEPVIVSTEGTVDGDGTIVSGTLNWGDGTVVSFVGAPDATYSNTYDVVGTYTITLTVLDNDFAGSAATAAVVVDLENQNPIAKLTFVSGEFAGSATTVSTSGTTDPDGSIASYSMNWGDGSSNDTGASPPATLQHTYASAGTRTATFTVTDNGSPALQGSTTISLTVQTAAPGNPPTATFSLSSGTHLGDDFEFAINGSDPDAGSVTWTLNYGDGTAEASGTGADLPSIQVHTYTAVGVYSAIFRITDTENLTTTKSVSVTVAEVPINPVPVVTLNYVSGQYRGEPYTLEVVVDLTVHNDIASGTLTWGDGQSDTWSETESEYTHTYTNAGFYTATITLTDDAGQVGTATRQVQIESRPPVNQAPVASITRLQGSFVNDTFVVSTAGTFDPDGSIAGGSIDWGDNTADTGFVGQPAAQYSHIYTTAGTKPCVLTVSDNQGAQDTDTVNITVSTAPTPGTHVYFDTLSALPERQFAWSLRSQSQLNSLVADPPAGKTYTDSAGTDYQAGFSYIYPSDPFADKQDAARFHVEPHLNSAGNLSNNCPVTQQLQFNWGQTLFTPGSRALIIWDFWWGEDFRDNHGETTNWKSFMVTLGGKKRFWTLIDNLGQAQGTGAPKGSRAADAECVSTRHDECAAGMGAGPYSDSTGTGFSGVNGIVYPTYPHGLGRAEGIAAVGPSAGPGAPNQRPFAAPNGVRTDHSCWTRYVVEAGMALPPSAFTAWNAGLGVTVQANPNDPTGAGRWHMLSVWTISARYGVQRSLFRCPINGNMQQWNPNLDGFRAEINTSKINPDGEFHGYMRNVVVLKNYTLHDTNPEQDTRIFSTQDLA